MEVVGRTIFHARHVIFLPRLHLNGICLTSCHLPLQLAPSPVYPWLQVQVKLPGALIQSQLASVAHTSAPEELSAFIVGMKSTSLILSVALHTQQHCTPCNTHNSRNSKRSKLFQIDFLPKEPAPSQSLILYTIPNPRAETLAGLLTSLLQACNKVVRLMQGCLSPCKQPVPPLY